MIFQIAMPAARRKSKVRYLRGRERRKEANKLFKRSYLWQGGTVGFRGRHSFFGSGKFLFDLLIEPLFELLFRGAGNVLKAETGKALYIDPGCFGLQFKLNIRAGK